MQWPWTWTKTISQYLPGPIIFGYESHDKSWEDPLLQRFWTVGGFGTIYRGTEPEVWPPTALPHSKEKYLWKTFSCKKWSVFRCCCQRWMSLVLFCVKGGSEGPWQPLLQPCLLWPTSMCVCWVGVCVPTFLSPSPDIFYIWLNTLTCASSPFAPS